MFAWIAKFIFIFQLLFVGSCFVTPVWSAENKATVALIIDSDSRIHEKAVTGIKQAIEKEDIHLRIVNINDEASSAAINSADINYAIAVGVKPASFAMKNNPAYPVLYTLVPESTYKKIIKDLIPASDHSPKDDYVIYLGQDASRQLALTRLVAGNSGRVGAVIGLHSGEQIKNLRSAASRTNTSLVTKQTLSENSAIDDIKQILKESDVYLALYDTNVLNRHNAKWLLYMAYKMSKPVIGFSSSYTRAGAVASIFSTPEQIGRQSGEWLIDMLNHRAVPKEQTPKYFTVTTNPNIQRMLKLERLSGEQLKKRIKHLEGGVNHD